MTVFEISAFKEMIKLQVDHQCKKSGQKEGQKTVKQKTDCVRTQKACSYMQVKARDLHRHHNGHTLILDSDLLVWAPKEKRLVDL